MRPRLSVFLLALPLALAPAFAQEAKAPKGLAGAGVTQEQVDAAIEKAKQFVLQEIGKELSAEEPRLSDHGMLGVFTLAHTDAFSTDRALARRAMTGVYRNKPGKTYKTALAIMTLEFLGGERHSELAQELADILVAQQTREGGWTYGAERPATGKVGSLPPPVETDPVIEVVGGVPIGGVGERARRLEARPPLVLKTGPDNSNGQFAMLGLHSAATVGLVAADETWRRCEAYWGGGQNPDGGWGYRSNDKSSYGSMTCAGLAGLAISLDRQGKDPMKDPRIKKGLAWLEKGFTVEFNPPNPRKLPFYHYYYLYGLERVGVLLGIDFVGDHEWYPEGARHLIAKQRDDGSFREHERDKESDTFADTCYAILFLTKGTTPLAMAKGGSGTLKTFVTGPPPEPSGLHVVLDASRSMSERSGDRTRFEAAKEAVKKLVAALPDDAPFGLRVYGHNPRDSFEVDPAESQLLVPQGKLDRAAVAKALDELTPLGRSPIALSLEACAKDLADGPRCRVLLVTDGGETGGGDPVAAARALAANPKCLGLDVLGTDLSPGEAKLAELAKAGGGRAAALGDVEAFARVSRASRDYRLTDKAGKLAARGSCGDVRVLPEGEYRFEVSIHGKAHQATVWINTGVDTTVRVHPERAKR